MTDAPTPGAVLDAESAAAWLELGERDDRTSPEEYPEMCLIEREELAEFMARAYRLARPTPDRLQTREQMLADLTPLAQPEPGAGELEVELNILEEIETVISVMRKGAVRRNSKRGAIVDIEATDTAMIRAAELLTAVTQALASQVSERRKNADRPRR